MTNLPMFQYSYRPITCIIFIINFLDGSVMASYKRDNIEKLQSDQLWKLKIGS